MVACIETTSDGELCVDLTVNLVDDTIDGAVEIFDSAASLFSSTPFTNGALPSAIDITALPAGAASVCITSSLGGSDCANFTKQSEFTLAINSDDCAALAAVATTTVIGCGSPSGFTAQLDGSNSRGPIGLYEWFINGQFAGNGELFETWLLPLPYLITLRVTAVNGETDVDANFVYFLFHCWVSYEPVEILLEDGETGTVVQWGARPDVVAYDVVRGDLANLLGFQETVGRGPVVCIENDSVNTSTGGYEDSETPAPGEGFFYLVTGQGGPTGVYGVDGEVRPRFAGDGFCP